MIKFGIVTPTYNRPDLLKRCVKSVQNQTYKNWIHVIIDDSTNNDTQDSFELYKSTIYVRNENNSGVGFSRNKGIEALINLDVDFIIFLDDDDYFSLDCLDKANQFILLNKEYKWFVSRRVFHSSERSLTEVKKVKESYNYVDDYLIGKAIRRDTTHFICKKPLQEKQVLFPMHVRGGGEWRFFAKLSEYIDFKFFEGGITYTELQENGLTMHNKDNKVFIASERADLVRYLMARDKFFWKQLEFSASVIKHFIKLGEIQMLSDFWQDCIIKQPLWAQLIFNVEKKIFLKKFGN